MISMMKNDEEVSSSYDDSSDNQLHTRPRASYQPPVLANNTKHRDIPDMAMNLSSSNSSHRSHSAHVRRTFSNKHDNNQDSLDASGSSHSTRSYRGTRSVRLHPTGPTGVSSNESEHSHASSSSNRRSLMQRSESKKQMLVVANDKTHQQHPTEPVGGLSNESDHSHASRSINRRMLMQRSESKNRGGLSNESEHSHISRSSSRRNLMQRSESKKHMSMFAVVNDKKHHHHHHHQQENTNSSSRLQTTGRKVVSKEKKVSNENIRYDYKDDSSSSFSADSFESDNDDGEDDDIDDDHTNEQPKNTQNDDDNNKNSFRVISSSGSNHSTTIPKTTPLSHQEKLKLFSSTKPKDSKLAPRHSMSASYHGARTINMIDSKDGINFLSLSKPADSKRHHIRHSISASFHTRSTSNNVFDPFDSHDDFLSLTKTNLSYTDNNNNIDDSSVNDSNFDDIFNFDALNINKTDNNVAKTNVSKPTAKKKEQQPDTTQKKKLKVTKTATKKSFGIKKTHSKEAHEEEKIIPHKATNSINGNNIVDNDDTNSITNAVPHSDPSSTTTSNSNNNSIIPTRESNATSSGDATANSMIVDGQEEMKITSNKANRPNKTTPDEVDVTTEVTCMPAESRSSSPSRRSRDPNVQDQDEVIATTTRTPTKSRSGSPSRRSRDLSVQDHDTVITKTARSPTKGRSSSPSRRTRDPNKQDQDDVIAKTPRTPTKSRGGSPSRRSRDPNGNSRSISGSPSRRRSRVLSQHPESNDAIPSCTNENPRGDDDLKSKSTCRSRSVSGSPSRRISSGLPQQLVSGDQDHQDEVDAQSKSGQSRPSHRTSAGNRSVGNATQTTSREQQSHLESSDHNRHDEDDVQSQIDENHSDYRTSVGSSSVGNSRTNRGLRQHLERSDRKSRRTTGTKSVGSNPSRRTSGKLRQLLEQNDSNSPRTSHDRHDDDDVKSKGDVSRHSNSTSGSRSVGGSPSRRTSRGIRTQPDHNGTSPVRSNRNHHDDNDDIQSTGSGSPSRKRRDSHRSRSGSGSPSRRSHTPDQRLDPSSPSQRNEIQHDDDKNPSRRSKRSMMGLSLINNISNSDHTTSLLQDIPENVKEHEKSDGSRNCHPDHYQILDSQNSEVKQQEQDNPAERTNATACITSPKRTTSLGGNNNSRHKKVSKSASPHHRRHDEIDDRKSASTSSIPDHIHHYDKNDGKQDQPEKTLTGTKIKENNFEDNPNLPSGDPTDSPKKRAAFASARIETNKEFGTIQLEEEQQQHDKTNNHDVTDSDNNNDKNFFQKKSTDSKDDNNESDTKRKKPTRTKSSDSLDDTLTSLRKTSKASSKKKSVASLDKSFSTLATTSTTSSHNSSKSHSTISSNNSMPRLQGDEHDGNNESNDGDDMERKIAKSTTPRKSPKSMKVRKKDDTKNKPSSVDQGGRKATKTQKKTSLASSSSELLTKDQGIDDNVCDPSGDDNANENSQPILTVLKISDDKRQDFLDTIVSATKINEQRVLLTPAVINGFCKIISDNPEICKFKYKYKIDSEIISIFSEDPGKDENAAADGTHVDDKDDDNEEAELFPLHMFCALGLPISCIRECCKAYPKAMVAVRDTSIGSPLHYSICSLLLRSSKISKNRDSHTAEDLTSIIDEFATTSTVLKFLVHMNAGMIIYQNKLSQQTPLHIACLAINRAMKMFDTKRSPSKSTLDNEDGNDIGNTDQIEANKSMQDFNDNVVKIIDILTKDHLPRILLVQDAKGDTPLHVACMTSTPCVVLVERLLHLEIESRKNLPKQNLNQSSCILTNQEGWCPLHVALYYHASTALIKQIVRANIEALRITDHKKRLPLHIALAVRIDDPATYKVLVRGYPNSLLMPNKNGERPHRIAKASQLDNSILKLLESK